MLKVQALAFGKLRGPGLREAADHYLKLSQKFVQLSERELKPLAVHDKNPTTRQAIQEKEQRILEQELAPRSCLFLLDEGGRALSTEGWAKLLRDLSRQSLSVVHFALGSSLGFSSTLKKKARGILSLGPQTLPHELARVVLYEQIFRATSLNAGHPYHVEG
ncbi:MAG: 23S rRNA (pseudouridine(1915)-N(3))-methyltransferase RlmH [Oligoflexia bacterium]